MCWGCSVSKMHPPSPIRESTVPGCGATARKDQRCGGWATLGLWVCSEMAVRVLSRMT